MSSDLIAFLNARLNEDYAVADALGSSWITAADSLTEAFTRRHDPARVLREVEAGRALTGGYMAASETYLVALDAHVRDVSLGRATTKAWLDVTATAMYAWQRAAEAKTAVYSDHPDYRLEWKP